MNALFSNTGWKQDNTRNSSFLNFILKTNYRSFLFISLLIGIVYFVLLKILYPIPTFNNDSYSWIFAAKNHLAVTYRPVFYSLILRFFKHVTYSDLALIAGQYFVNLFSNLFLFFTCCYFFNLKKLFRILLFGFIIMHPFYVISSNYVMSDPFFNGLAVCWFSLLIWIIYRPTIYIVLLQLVVLTILFLLRYNAIVFPVITAIALFFSRLSTVKKVAYISGHFMVILMLVFTIIKLNKQHTGVSSFSNFGGWQLANDAMTILRYQKIDTTRIDNDDTKKIIRYVTPFFDTAKNIPKGATAFYFDRLNSPLQRYMFANSTDSNYFKNWNSISPIYNTFGKTIILNNPYAYVKYFVKPNTKAYLIPPLEAYEAYNKGTDTLRRVMQEFFNYKSKIVPKTNPMIYPIVFAPIPYLFTLINVSLIVLIVAYYATGRYKTQGYLFNKSLLCFVGLYLGNCLFIIPLAPTVLRYHNFILTLGLLFTLLLLNSLDSNEKMAIADTV